MQTSLAIVVGLGSLEGHVAPWLSARTIVACLIYLLGSTVPLAAQEVAFSPEVMASVNNDGGRLRVEPSAVIVGDTAIVAWNDSRAGRDFGVRTGVGIAWSVSSNGGGSFDFGGYLPSAKTHGGPSGSDSWLSATSTGDVLLQLLHWGEHKQEFRVYALVREAKTDWVLRGTFAGKRIDKPAMATAGKAWVGVAYTAGSEIRFSRSTDGGATWDEPRKISATGCLTRIGAGIAACRDEVLVVWLEGEGLDLKQIWSAWSRDGGQSFSKPAKVRSLERSLAPPPGYSLGVGPAGFIANNAWVACSPAAVPVFHVAYAEGRAEGSVVLYQQARLEGAGIRWTKPDIVAGADSTWAVFPSVAVFDQTVGILYYDSRHSDRSSTLMDVYLSVVSHGRSTDHRVTTVSTPWSDVPGDREHAPVQRNFGDYITLTADGQRGLAAWTDGRTGTPRIMTRRFSLREPVNGPTRDGRKGAGR